MRRGEGWESVSLRNYGSEDDLQALLAASPELIPGCKGSFAIRELAVPGAGQIDIVCVDEDGSLTLVECKLAKSSEIRRAVVGQIFAYASALDGMSYEEFTSRFQAHARGTAARGSRPARRQRRAR